MIKEIKRLFLKRHQVEIEISMAIDNLDKIRLFCIATTFISILLIALDSSLAPTSATVSFKQYYLFLDVILFVLSIFFYIITKWVEKKFTEIISHLHLAVFAYSVSIVAWSGIMSALECATYGSEITLVLCVLLIAIIVQIPNYMILIVFLVGFLSFFISDYIIQGEVEHLFTEHFIVFSCIILGWFLNRSLYISRGDLLESQATIVEKNRQLEIEIDLRTKAQQSMKELQKQLKKKFDDRGIELLETNKALEDETAERVKVQQSLIQAQKMESIGRLAGGVAHDYNNMSTIIIGYSELILQSLNPKDRLYEDLKEIHEAAVRSSRITRQLLTFARKQTVQPEVINLNEHVTASLKMLISLVGEDIQISFEPTSDIWPINMDPTQIDQIMVNLCVNARDAIANTGKIDIIVENIRLDEDYISSKLEANPGDYVSLTIADTGVGIEQDRLDQVFEPFYTTKGMEQGTGLGLATVYGIVQQNKGVINIYSELGNGTQISTYLPRYQGNVKGQKSVINGELPSGNGKVILLVEDDETILLMSKRMLVSLGYEVIPASLPQQAIQLAKQKEKIEILMTDVIMPEMNGHELATKISKIKPDVKILYVSGYTADIISKRGIIDKGVNFISKPFSKKALAQKLEKLYHST